MKPIFTNYGQPLTKTFYGNGAVLSKDSSQDRGQMRRYCFKFGQKGFLDK